MCIDACQRDTPLAKSGNRIGAEARGGIRRQSQKLKYMGLNAYFSVKEDPQEKESWHTEVHPGFDLVPLAVRTEMHVTQANTCSACSGSNLAEVVSGEGGEGA